MLVHNQKLINLWNLYPILCHILFHYNKQKTKISLFLKIFCHIWATLESKKATFTMFFQLPSKNFVSNLMFFCIRKSQHGVSIWCTSDASITRTQLVRCQLTWYNQIYSFAHYFSTKFIQILFSDNFYVFGGQAVAAATHQAVENFKRV